MFSLVLNDEPNGLGPMIRRWDGRPQKLALGFTSCVGKCTGRVPDEVSGAICYGESLLGELRTPLPSGDGPQEEADVGRSLCESSRQVRIPGGAERHIDTDAKTLADEGFL